MSGRRFDPGRREMMDCAQDVTPLLAQDLRNLERLNAWFGGHALVARMVVPWLAARQQAAVLDLACGAGDIARLLVRKLAEQTQCRVRVTAVDANPAIITLAREFAAADDRIDFVVSDALQYIPANAPDLVMCTLALHHFDRDTAVRLLVRMRDLAGAHGRMLVTDLRRSRWTEAGVWALTACCMRNPMTRHDARLSLRQAWSMREMRDLAQLAGWRGFRQQRGPWGRQALWC